MIGMLTTQYMAFKEAGIQFKEWVAALSDYHTGCTCSTADYLC